MKNIGNSSERLVLGTAQLGFSYGIANKTGQPDRTAARKIVQAAWDKGVCEFDTAPTYGSSEDVLGQILLEAGVSAQARITSKLYIDPDRPLPETVVPVIENSIERLKISKIHCLMMHNEAMLKIWNSGLEDLLMNCREKGLFDRIGVSVYTPEKAIEALETQTVSVVQIPGNILDHRFESKGVFDLAARLSKTIYIRSIFLQGLLLMNRHALPEKMHFASKVLKEVEGLTRETGFSKLELTMGFIKAAYPDAKVIFGAETSRQVQMNMAAWENPIPEMVSRKIRQLFQDTSEKIVNPSLWPV